MSSPRVFFRVLQRSVLLVTLISATGWGRAANGQPADAEPIVPTELQFFEEKIRPVLVEKCYSCHSTTALQANKLKGGLRVDSRAALLSGGETGPAIMPGNPEASLLLKALQYDSVQMPPDGKLSEQVIADFRRWIQSGCADPRRDDGPATVRKSIDLEAGRQHWAYRPLAKPVIPIIAGEEASYDKRSAVQSGLSNVVDVFIAFRLQEQQLESAGSADKSVLIRRLYFDLLGLPPEPAAIAEFNQDNSPDAYERLVDRLLASPHFGERWGRHWLSVARFAESVTLRGFIFPEAWRYRDYVIETFNEDRPYDRFMLEQVAGDLLDADSLGSRQRQVIATTFLTLGNINLEEQDKPQLQMDVVDEQLDVIGKGFLGQTLGCARCHDHKFDPIPTRDYYAMAGILANVKTLEHANVSKWLELPLPIEPDEERQFQQQEMAIARTRDAITALQKQISASETIAIADLPGIVMDDRQGKIVGQWQRSQSNKPYVGDGYLHDQDQAKGEKTITFLPELAMAGKYEVRLGYTPGDNRSDAVPVTVMSADGETTILVNQRQRPPVDNVFVSLGEYRFESNGQNYVIVSTAGTKGHVVVDAVQFISTELPAEAKPPAERSKGLTAEQSTGLTQELSKLQKELKRLQSEERKRPRYMSVQEVSRISDLQVHIRGTVHNLGERVPRGFLQVASSASPTVLPSAQSGRKELGKWLGHRDNPLTPRVMSNRIWSWLFGRGLSRTPDNFGTTGDSPSHPELLDYLSSRFLERSWQIKPIIREVVCSHAYRQQSEPTAEQISADPENQWLAHQNRRRLDAECLLDAILTINGTRNDQLGGSTIRQGVADDYAYLHGTTRRSVYWPVFRNSLPPIFEAFDFADPSTSAGSRNVSTVAPQALFFLNDDWVIGSSASAAEHLLSLPLSDESARIDYLFLSSVGRRPRPTERELAQKILAQGDSPATAWATLVQALLSTFDFRYVE